MGGDSWEPIRERQSEGTESRGRSLEDQTKRTEPGAGAESIGPSPDGRA